MKLWKPLLALLLAATMSAQQIPPPPPPPTAHAQPQKGKKKSYRKWIVIGAVAAGAVVALVLVNKRLGNEGAGIFR
jgi:hypothetical protein